jgi:divalent metal cation (Fe/Co/Zn/Cd) transporter
VVGGTGLVLLVSSLLLAQETKGLLIGEPAHARVRDAILRIACEDPDVRTANGVLTMQMGVNQIIAALSVAFHDTLNTTQIEMCVNRIETAIKQAQPDITILFVKPQSAKTWRRRIEQLAATSGHDPDTD